MQGLDFPDNLMAIFGFKRANMNNQKKWDLRFLELAKHISTWSKDPSTQVGCVIVDENNRIISTGYNGFPKGIIDSAERYNDRDLKYSIVVHSEPNAIIFAQRDLTNCTIYTYPMPPCARCSGLIIQAGIKRIVAIEATSDQIKRWGDDFDLSLDMYKEAKIEFILYKKTKESKIFNKCSGDCKCKKD